MAKSARKTANGLFSIERVLGTLPPIDGRTLYNARIDPYLINSADIIIDPTPSAGKDLSDVQLVVLRRLLGVNSQSMTAPLFTELNILPLPYRRVTMALRFLKHMLNGTKSRLLPEALDVCASLRRDGHKNWLSDLCTALANLECPISCEMPSEMIIPLDIRSCTPSAVDTMIKAVSNLAKSTLQAKIDISVRCYLLHNRLEPLPYPEKPAYKALFVRHYLHLSVPKHRKALVRLLLSDHPLALEQLRRADRFHAFVPRDERLCRLCGVAVETPEHAILLCNADVDLVKIRSAALSVVQGTSLQLNPSLINELNALDTLKGLIFQDACLPVIAKLVYDIMEIYKTFELPRPRRDTPLPVLRVWRKKIPGARTLPPRKDTDSDSDSDYIP